MNSIKTLISREMDLKYVLEEIVEENPIFLNADNYKILEGNTIFIDKNNFDKKEDSKKIIDLSLKIIKIYTEETMIKFELIELLNKEKALKYNELKSETNTYVDTVRSGYEQKDFNFERTLQQKDRDIFFLAATFIKDLKFGEY